MKASSSMNKPALAQGPHANKRKGKKIKYTGACMDKLRRKGNTETQTQRHRHRDTLESKPFPGIKPKSKNARTPKPNNVSKRYSIKGEKENDLTMLYHWITSHR